MQKLHLIICEFIKGETFEIFFLKELKKKKQKTQFCLNNFSNIAIFFEDIDVTHKGICVQHIYIDITELKLYKRKLNKSCKIF